MRKSKKQVGVFREIAYKELPVTRIAVQKPVNNTFEPIDESPKVETAQEIMSKDINLLKAQTADEKLLDAEMEKPFAARNKGLMSRFNIRYSVRNVDVYPPADGKSRKITISIPEDVTVPLTMRPTPWYGTVEIQDSGNLLVFRFPYHKVPELDVELYKLDGLPVWLNSKTGVIDDTRSDYTLYQALWDIAHSNTKNRTEQHAVFQKYNMLKSTSIDYMIRNQGFGVSYEDWTPPQVTTVPPTVLPPTPTSQGTRTTTTTDLWTTTLTPSQLDKSHLGDHIVNRIVGLAINASQQANGVQFFGENAIHPPIPPSKLFLEAVVGNKSSSSAIQFMLSSYNKATGNYGFSIIEGKAALAKLISGLKNTEADCLKFIRQQNDKIVDTASSGNGSVSSVFL